TLGKAGNGDDVTGMRLLDRLALDAAKGEDLGDAAGLQHRAVMMEHLDRLIGLQAAAIDAAGNDAAKEGIGFENRTDHAEWAIADRRRGNMLEHEIEQRRQALVPRAF